MSSNRERQKKKERNRDRAMSLGSKAALNLRRGRNKLGGKLLDTAGRVAGVNTTGLLKKTMAGGAIVGLLATGITSLTYFASNEDDGQTKAYVDNENVVDINNDGSYTVSELSNANAACKAYYQYLAQHSVWQVSDDGILIKPEDQGSKSDFFKRDNEFYLEPDLLYSMNSYIFSDVYVYPEAFMKPVPYDEEYKLLPLTDENGKIAVKSKVLDKNGLPTGEEQASISDYGLASVLSYTTFVESTNLEGSYVKEDYYDEETRRVLQRDINEPFSINIKSEQHDILDKVVTYAGSISYEYTPIVSKISGISDGESENEADAVRKIKYDTVTVTIYSAHPVTQVNRPRRYSTDLEALKRMCEAENYEIDGEVGPDGTIIPTVTSRSYDLYKYRSDDTGTYVHGVNPSTKEVQDLGNVYLYNYLGHFETYKPMIQRTYETFRQMTSKANTEAYQQVSRPYNYQASNAEVEAWLEEVGPIATKIMEETGVTASVALGQAIKESGAYPNSSKLALDYNNWYGIKQGSWTGPVCYFDTQERAADGSIYTVRGEAWCAFEDIEQCMLWRAEMLWWKRYQNCIGVTDPYECAYLIATDGWCTDIAESYAQSIADIVEMYDLERFNTEWNGQTPEFASGNLAASSYDPKLGKTTSTLNDYDKFVFQNFVHAVDNTEGNCRYEYYYHALSTSEINEMLRLTETFINGTTMTQESMTDNTHLWQKNYLTDLADKDYNYTDMVSVAIGSAKCFEEMDIIYPLPENQTAITSRFGPRNIAVAGASKNHLAVDIGCPSGTPVYAMADGVVTVATNSGGRGNTITISHGLNSEGLEVQTEYLHMSTLSVSVGDVVNMGQQIGTSGNTGVGSGPHLDFRISVNNVYYNFYRAFPDLQSVSARDINGNRITISFSGDENWVRQYLYYSNGSFFTE